MTLDSSKVPTSCIPLLELAERWGIGDDHERESAVANAPREVLRQLVDAIQQMPDDNMFEWLAGPESHSADPSPEYLAFTCLTMAYDSAKLKLKR
jgi:hypothetical protein